MGRPLSGDGAEWTSAMLLGMEEGGMVESSTSTSTGTGTNVPVQPDLRSLILV